MSKLNPTLKAPSKFEPSAKLAGGYGVKAAKQPDIQNLRRLVLTGLLWEDSFYIDGAAASEQIVELIAVCDARQVTDLAIECRQKQKLRHMPLFMLAHLLKCGKGQYVADALPKVCTRADMMTDFLALYEKINGKVKPLAASVKKGLAASFSNFDEYQFAKYDRDAKFKLRDVIRLCHPKPEGQEQSELWQRVKDRTLKTPDTWEVGLSAAKSDAEKRGVWERLINEDKLPALAFLRNLRNMRQVDVPASIIRQGFAKCKSSMLLPLNFLSAATENPEFKKDIEDLMLRTYANAPKLPGRTLFIVDRSVSMNGSISEKSKFTRQQVANAMAMLAVNMCEDCSLVITAGNDGSRQHASELLKYPPRGFDLFDSIQKALPYSGGGIFTRQVLEWSRESLKGDFDRVIVFSDSQDCDISKKLPKPFGKSNYIVDVSSHKHGINYKGVWTAEISGWSENFLTFIAGFEGINNTFESDN